MTHPGCWVPPSNPPQDTTGRVGFDDLVQPCPEHGFGCDATHHDDADMNTAGGHEHWDDAA